MRRLVIAVIALLVIFGGAWAYYGKSTPPPAPVDRLESIGPTIISNQTSYPLTLYGAELVIADELAGQLGIYSTSKRGAPRIVPLGEWPEDLDIEANLAWVTTRQGKLLLVDLAHGVLGGETLPGRQPRSVVV